MSLKDLLNNTTPGPWRYRESDGWVLDAADYFVVRQAGRNPEVVASARLIALATDAVALLIDMAQAIGDRTDQGHNDTCDVELSPGSGYDCTCGHDGLVGVLARFAALNEKAGT